jgi:Family of unknown function (DUF6491)
MRNKLISKLTRAPIAVVIFGLASVSALADTHEHQMDELARFKQYAGSPVDEFKMVDVFQTQIVGDKNVVVWPAINAAYLITVDKPCLKLEWAKGFGVTQKMTMKVTKAFDFITFENQRCKIIEIRPVDYKAMLKEDKEKKATQAGGT